MLAVMQARWIVMLTVAAAIPASGAPPQKRPPGF
jgi:hypothetical protein